MIKEAGKAVLAEIKVTSDIEELSVKEYKTVLQKLTAAVTREKQMHTLKAIQEKNKSVNF